MTGEMVMVKSFSPPAPLLSEMVERCIRTRGYVVLRFTPSHPYKAGDMVRAFVDGPPVFITDRTDWRDWSKQVKLALEVGGSRAIAKPCRGVQYYRAIPVGGAE